MEEQRRHYRFTVEGVHCNILSATEVEIINMSVGGVALMANGRLDIGKEYALKLEENGRTCSVRGVIVWSVLTGSRRNRRGEIVPVYKAGLRFKERQSEKMTEILDFIEHHKKSPEQRIIVRFAVRSPEKATLNYPLDFKVKKISFSGFLLETGQAFSVDDVYPMEITLGEGKKIGFTGRVASCLQTSDGEPEQYDVGIDFCEISDASMKAIEEFIKSL